MRVMIFEVRMYLIFTEGVVILTVEKAYLLWISALKKKRELANSD